MRIATISYHGCPLAAPGSPSTGGMQVYVRELSRALGALGHQVDVFTRRTSSDVSTIVEDFPGVRVIHLSAGPAEPVTKSELSEYVQEFTSAIERFQRSSGESYDVIHSHYWLSGRAGIGLANRWGVPHVTMFHTLGEIKNRARIGERESDLRLGWERVILGEVDRVIVASPHERQQLIRFFDVPAERITIVPCGVDLGLFQPIDRAEARRELGITEKWSVLFVGRLEPLKGIDILMRAVAGAEERNHIAVLLVGGSSDGHSGEAERLKRLAAELGIADHVRFIGPMSQERLPLFYSAADVTIVPSYYESFGLVAVESMACGTPVIASRVGGLSSTIRDGETGYLIPWRCPEAFLERLELLLGNDALRKDFGTAAMASVERFRWSNIAVQITAAYASLEQSEDTLLAVGH